MGFPQLVLVYGHRGCFCHFPILCPGSDVEFDQSLLSLSPVILSCSLIINNNWIYSRRHAYCRIKLMLNPSFYYVWLFIGLIMKSRSTSWLFSCVFVTFP